jgi:hypothetical protein
LSASIALAIGWASSANAGSNAADLACTSKDKARSTNLQGRVPWDFHELDLTLRVGQSLTKLRDDAGDRTTSFEAIDDGVYLLEYSDSNPNDGGIRLHAIPATVRVKKKYGGLDATFDARLNSWGKFTVSNVRLTCTLHYEI